MIDWEFGAGLSDAPTACDDPDCAICIASGLIPGREPTEIGPCEKWVFAFGQSSTL